MHTQKCSRRLFALTMLDQDNSSDSQTHRHVCAPWWAAGPNLALKGVHFKPDLNLCPSPMNHTSYTTMGYQYHLDFIQMIESLPF